MLWIRVGMLSLAALLIATPISAFALIGPVLCAFGDSYTATDGSTATHRGVDVSAQPGESVCAPRTGHVRFAGRIPGTAGTSVLAVSIETAEGVITLMPLSELAVSAGQTISQGDSVGTLAANGDASSASPHVHVGLKRGDVYLDPSCLLDAPTTASEQNENEPQPVLSGGTVAAGSAPEVKQRASSVPRTSAPAVASTALAPRAAAAGATGAPSTDGAARPAAPPAPLRAPAPGIVLSPGVSIPGSAAQAVPPVSTYLQRSMNVGDISSSGDEDSRGARLRGLPSAGVVSAFVTLTLAAVLLTSRRAMTRRLSSGLGFSGRLGHLLQHL